MRCYWVSNMTDPRGILLLAAIAVCGLCIYGLHRLGLWLDDRGLLYYRKDKLREGAGGALFGLQEIIQPTVQHVIEAEDEQLQNVDDDEGDTRWSLNRHRPG